MTKYKGQCRECPGEFRIKADGTVFFHTKPGMHLARLRPGCPGSGRTPRSKWEVKDGGKN